MGATALIAAAVIGAGTAVASTEQSKNAQRKANQDKNGMLQDQANIEKQQKDQEVRDEATAQRDQLRGRQKANAASTQGRGSTILTSSTGSVASGTTALTGGGQKTLLGV